MKPTSKCFRAVRLIRVAALAILATPVFAQHHKVAASLETLDEDSVADVIVQYAKVPDEQHHQKVLARGGVLHEELGIIRSGHYSIPARALHELADDPEVLHISPNHTVQSLVDSAETAINANIAFSYGWTGGGIGIAIIDSGISNHPDLKDSKGNLRVVYSQDFVGGGTDDHYGHGQHVAGIASGNGQSSSASNATLTFRGVAPNANLINLRVLDQNGMGSDSGVIAAIQKAIQLKKQYNIRVINLSLGRPVFESYTVDPVCQAVEQAWKAGIVVVVAAGNQGRNNSLGNNGYFTIQAPANDPYVITVGAMNTKGTLSRSDDVIASYSSKGPTPIDHIVKPDLVAPGNRVVSLLASTAQLQNQYPLNAVPLTSYETTGSGALANEYYIESGTSMAAPMVSGAAALLLQQNPNLTPDQVKARLMKTATKTFPPFSIATDPTTGTTYTSEYDIFTVGAGYVDIWAALNSSDYSNLSASSPTAIKPNAYGNIYVVNTPIAVGGSSAMWGSSGHVGLQCNMGFGGVGRRQQRHVGVQRHVG